MVTLRGPGQVRAAAKRRPAVPEPPALHRLAFSAIGDGEEPEVPAHGVHLQRSEEHTSELQSPCNLVCRLLLEKKKKNLIEMTEETIHRYTTLASKHREA